MHKNKVVIATHSNVECLNLLLQAYDNFGFFNKYDVYIVETGNDIESIKYMEIQLKERKPFERFTYIRSNGIYDTGAYVLIYENFLKHLDCLDKKVFFSHDSIIPTKVDSIEKMMYINNSDSVTAWYTHQLFFDSEKQKKYCKEMFDIMKIGLSNYNFDTIHEYLIFGPIFSTSLDIMRKLRSNFNLSKLFGSITCKEEQCGMERLWGILFQTLHIPIYSLESTVRLNKRINLYEKECISGEFFNKLFLHRT